MKKYNPQSIEKKWQEKWEKESVYVARDFSEKEKKYVLIEFPYPSGEGLHMGHLRPYVAGDAYGRFLRMNRYEVMYPIGWDAFGLPAENFAIKMGIHPSVSTAKNIENAKKQLKSWGMGFDWSREVNTTDPEYYKWTQWIFLKLFKKGLAYEAKGFINWCPSCKTGLANEEVAGGVCERCGTKAEKKELRQWYLKITEYAEKLLEGLKTLEWDDKIKIQQENWIGKSEGAVIKFQITNDKSQTNSKLENQNSELFIDVFTTRPDTLFGATYMVVSPEHEFLANSELQIANREEVEKYIAESKNKSEEERIENKEKTGVELKGIKAINPANNEEIPIFVADYVLSGYGTGAIMAVPAHDERDFEFAKKFNLPIIPVITPEADGVGILLQIPNGKYLFQIRDNNTKRDPGRITPIGGKKEKKESVFDAVKREIREELDIEEKVNNLELIGLFPSQNTLGEMITMFYCNIAVEPKSITEGSGIYACTLEEALEDKRVTNFTKQIIKEFKKGCGAYIGDGVLVNSKQFDGLSVEEAKWKITEFVKGEKKVQYRLRDWVFSRQRYWGEPVPLIFCENCKKLTENLKQNQNSKFEIQNKKFTLGEVLNPGWVVLDEKDLPLTLPDVKKYEPTGTGESPLAAIDSWVNTTCPKCGGPAKRETNTMPQWAGSSWYYIRYADPKNKHVLADKKLIEHWLPVDVYFGGMEHTTLHLLYSRFWHKFLYDEGIIHTPEPYMRRVPHGIVLGSDGEKMSKSRGNVVNPDLMVKEFGADALRMYEMFLGPHDAMVSWNEKGILGVSRFLERAYRFVMSQDNEGEEDTDTQRALHTAVKKVSEDIRDFKFNTAISALMIFLNNIEGKKVSSETKKSFILLLAPFAPHIAEEMWEFIGEKFSITHAKWPSFDTSRIEKDTFILVIQVNGKVRDQIEVKRGITQDEARELAFGSTKVKTFVDGKTEKKVIYVPEKIINIVVV